MAVDYEGFGLSEGEPSEEATYADSLAAFDFLAAKGVDPRRILIHGFSLGGGVAVQLALAKKQFNNPLVLESTFTSLRDAGAGRTSWLRPFMFLVLGDAYNSQARLAQLSPSYLLVFHGPEDEVIPFSQGQSLYEGFTGTNKKFVTLAGRHMDFLINQELFHDAILDIFGPGGHSPNWPLSQNDQASPGEDPGFGG
jgi:fermentation-respiration switch protein FrsA (DUF1100 family)